MTEICEHFKGEDLKFGNYFENEENTIDFKYVKNLCLKNPIPFEIPNNVDLFQRICMMFSYNDFSYLNDHILIEHEFIGLVPIDSTIPLLFVNVKSESVNKEKYKFSTRKYTFEKKVEALNIDEQIRLAFHMIYTYNTEKCEYLRKTKIQAYVDRLLFHKNENHFLLNRLVLYFESLINLETKYLENILNENYFVTDKYLFKIPLIFKREIEINLANIYFKLGSFEKALEIFEKLHLVQGEIECLINLRRNNEAIEKIQEQMEICKSKDKILYCNYCIKLGHLTKKVKFFDQAFEAYKSFEPLKEKAIFLHKNNQFLEAKDAYEQTLKIVPQNESVLYGYASVKIILKEYLSCIDLFLRLIEINKRNPEYHRNLALCYYNIKDVDKCMESLKKNSLQDSTSLDLYFKLCIKNRNKEGILWYIRKIRNKDTFDKLVSFLLQEKYINEEEVLDCVKLQNFS